MYTFKGFFLNIFFILLLAFKVHGQSAAFKIIGKIVDEKNIPLEYVTVYINSSSIFTHTDSLGGYVLMLPSSKVDFELVVSMVGFNIQKLKFTKNSVPEFLTIKLINNQLNELVVRAKHDKYWYKKWQIFRNGLLGENQYSRQCAFENDENINLSFDYHEKIVLANSTNTFIILNNALGYKIHVDLHEFSSDGNKTSYSALKYFEENLSKDENKRKTQLKNRQNAFKGTQSYFLHSLANRNLKEANFEVFKVKNIADIFLGSTTVRQLIEDGNLIKTNDSTIYKYDSVNDRHILFSNLPLLVFNKNVYSYYKNPFSDYSFAFSKIELPNYYAVFSENGFISIPNGIFFHYTWGSSGLASALPENYEVPSKFPVEKIEPTIKLYFEQGSIDSLKVNPSSSANQNTSFTKSDDQLKDNKKNNFVRPDFSFKPTELEKGQDIFTLLNRLPGLKVALDMESGEYNIWFSGSNTNLGQNTAQDNTPALLYNNRLFSGRKDVIYVLEFIETNRITEIGLVKYGNSAMMGARGGTGTIIIKTE
jgi:hypothetical protein